MQTRKLGYFATAVAALTTTPAMADEWWLAFMGGEKPARLVVAIDEMATSEPARSSFQSALARLILRYYNDKGGYACVAGRE